MPQINSIEAFGDIVKKLTSATNLAVSVPASGNTTVLNVNVKLLERIFVQIDVTAFALDAFIIKAKAMRDASSATLYSISADYTAPSGFLVGTSGDLTAIAAAASGWFAMDVRGLDTVSIDVSATGAATVSVYFGGQ